eukprot:2021769-Pyramimonas_sp.AAC.1
MSTERCRARLSSSDFVPRASLTSSTPASTTEDTAVSETTLDSVPNDSKPCAINSKPCAITRGPNDACRAFPPSSRNANE